jgi:hypothetical protein
MPLVTLKFVGFELMISMEQIYDLNQLNHTP